MYLHARPLTSHGITALLLSRKPIIVQDGVVALERRVYRGALVLVASAPLSFEANAAFRVCLLRLTTQAS